MRAVGVAVVDTITFVAVDVSPVVGIVDVVNAELISGVIIDLVVVESVRCTDSLNSAVDAVYSVMIVSTFATFFH